MTCIAHDSITIKGPLLSVLLPEFDSVLWIKLGAEMLDLRFRICSLTAEIFYEILRHCPKLKSLELIGEVSHSA